MVNGTLQDGPGFTGHVQDTATGLTYMQQRYYDPVVGRFLSVDPIVTDFNTGKLFGRYTYVDNNPYTKIDPDGRFGVAGAIIGAGVEVGAQLLAEGKVNNWTAVAVSGAAGFVTGGLGGVLGKSVAAGATSVKTAVTATAAVGGVTAATGKLIEGEVNRKPATSAQVAVAAGFCTVGAAVGARIGLTAEAKIAEMASKPGVPGHIGQTTQNAMQQGGKINEPTVSVSQKAAQNTVDVTANVTEKKVN